MLRSANENCHRKKTRTVTMTVMVTSRDLEIMKMIPTQK